MKYIFKGDSALVSGAGSGIGEATAHLLAINGVRVVASDIDFEAARRVTQAIIAAGGRAVAHEGNAAKPERRYGGAVLH